MQTNNQGLFYLRGDGSNVSLSEESEQWLVTLRTGGGVFLRRFVDGRIDESYREMDDAEGAVAILGAILGAIRKIVWKTGIAAQQLNGDDNAINHANQPR